METAESLPSTASSIADTPSEIAIEGLKEPTVLCYFKTLNAGDFEATAALFATNGAMHAPFESAIVGPAAIAAYLQQEARGMKLFPRQGITQTLDSVAIQVQVSGKVETSWCGVNVSWIFVLNQEREILTATIKLLASPQELLNLRR